jgi:peptidoglycan/LPS O-acetylase OafA/YrhL
VFIALEELGYIVMSLVFLCLAPVFAERTGLDRGIRWLFLGSFAATVISFVLVSVGMGMDRGDAFEIIVISIVWLTLVAAGPLLAIRFHRAQRHASATPAARD